MNQFRWADLHVGLTQEFETVVTPEMAASFVTISGDDNPLHVDDAYARQRGFPGRVVHGLLTSSFYSTLVGVHLPGERCLLHGIDVQFLKPVFIGDRLRISGAISYLMDAYRQAQISARIDRLSDDETVSKAKIKVGVHE